MSQGTCLSSSPQTPGKTELTQSSQILFNTIMDPNPDPSPAESPREPSDPFPGPNSNEPGYDADDELSPKKAKKHPNPPLPSGNSTTTALDSDDQASSYPLFPPKSPTTPSTSSTVIHVARPNSLSRSPPGSIRNTQTNRPTRFTRSAPPNLLAADDDDDGDDARITQINRPTRFTLSAPPNLVAEGDDDDDDDAGSESTFADPIPPPPPPNLVNNPPVHPNDDDDDAGSESTLADPPPPPPPPPLVNNPVFHPPYPVAPVLYLGAPVLYHGINFIAAPPPPPPESPAAAADEANDEWIVPDYTFTHYMPEPWRLLGAWWRRREGEEGEEEVQSEWRLMFQRRILGGEAWPTQDEQAEEEWRIRAWWNRFELEEDEEARRIADDEETLTMAAWSDAGSSWDSESGRDVENDEAWRIAEDEARIAEDEARIAAWSDGDDEDDGGWEGEGDDGGWEDGGWEDGGSSWDGRPDRDVEDDEARRIAEDEEATRRWLNGEDGDNGEWQGEGYEYHEEEAPVVEWLYRLEPGGWEEDGEDGRGEDRWDGGDPEDDFDWEMWGSYLSA